MTETAVFEVIRKQIEQVQAQKSKPVRVAINGIEGTGKTVFAEKLTQYLLHQGFKALHVSIDGFHFNREHRYRQGRDSARGYYEDSYDEQAFTDKVLLASQQENPAITTATHHLETDAYLTLTPVGIPADSILITDGAYLFKPVYKPHWDVKIYLKTDFETARLRGANRDASHLGGLEAAQAKFVSRYHEASKIYISENQPEEIADLVIDNTVFEDLRLIKAPVNRSIPQLDFRL